MASTQHVLLSPAELAYLHASLSLSPPIRPDGRAPTQFRPLVAETDILPGTNGSARICFADGTEAIVGVKAEVERTRGADAVFDPDHVYDSNSPGDEAGQSDWVELSVEIPGVRDDDTGVAFLSAVLSEALLADVAFSARLRINRRFHWKLYLDILLISPPLSYPLPLLSLTTHLALLSTRLPRLKSEGDEDPFFDDDWAAAPHLFPRHDTATPGSRPPITLLVMAAGRNIIFDPSKEELAVADVALAVSVSTAAADTAKNKKGGRSLRLLSVRTIDPPSRLTPPGVANEANSAYGAKAAGLVAGQGQKQPEARAAEAERVEGVWRAPRGGSKAGVLAALVGKVLEEGGVVDEVLEALEGVDLG
ncbi:ribosomal protein S5 domain 2-type protein [Podospora conica]|nr:ribosomal protein S5 domain 2-type protein [Schizothecium conicum]